ncbi:MAG: phenylalanine--tRNA ligase subunit beta [Patescibacteria group bacterium]
MLISKHWLQKFFSVPLPESEALGAAITFHAFEIDGIASYDGDDIFDIKITPNRGHDCLSHRGIAREVSAILNIPLTSDPLAETVVLAPTTDQIQVSIEDADFCPRYVAGLIKGVTVGPSPAWLKKNLEALGQRSINNIVDATNFVMFNIGQPIHAFDAAKLTQKDGIYSIAVRAARAGEKMMALDNKEYTFTEGMSVIADAHADIAIGIAGIKGGMPAGVTEATKDIIIEVANFAGVPVRRTASLLKLRTDASARYEQVLSPTLAAFGMHSVAALIQKIAGGEVVGFLDTYPSPQKETRVEVTMLHINRVLGTTLSGAEVADVFTRLGFAYKEDSDVFEVLVPKERLDITIAQDLIEEIARLLGYDKIAEVELPPLDKMPEVNKQFLAAEEARERLVHEGYSEVFTSVFAEAGERAVLNKVDSVKPFMRTTLVDGLTDALKKNIPNKDLLGLKEIKLFEIGYIWKDGKETLMLGTITEKQPAKEEQLGKATSDGYAALPLSLASQFVPYSKYPYIVRDIAVWTPASSNKEEVPKMSYVDEARALIYTEAGSLAQKVSLFDEFQKGEKTSLGFRIIFQSFDRTLTEVEVNEVMQKVSAALAVQGFEIR